MSDGLEISITTTIPAAVKDLRAVMYDQVPFATALALTRTAQDAQEQVRRELPKRFTLRSGWVVGGIRIRAATKRKPQAEVYSRDDFMALQELGGVKRPRGRSIALPRGIRRNKRGAITRAQRPKRVLERPGVFVAPAKKGGRAIYKRKGPKRYPIQTLYRLYEGTVHIRSRFEFEKTVRQVVEKRWAKNFGAAFARALKTRRR